MARSSECTEQYAQKVLDTADIVRDAMFHQQCLKRCNILLRIVDTHVSAFETWAVPYPPVIDHLLIVVSL
jgi:hypothetical protein